MMVHKQEKGWVIARNFEPIDGNGIGNNDISRVRQTYDVWDGRKWVSQRHYARHFDTQDAAQQFLDENRDVLSEA